MYVRKHVLCVHSTSSSITILMATYSATLHSTQHYASVVSAMEEPVALSAAELKAINEEQ